MKTHRSTRLTHSCLSLMIAGLAFATSTSAVAAQKTVCTVTINSSDERAMFIKKLPAGDFKFVELTEFDKSAQSYDRAQSKWFENACAAKVQCDILLVSAHFGGFFWGTSQYMLSMEQLEKNSCANTCDGILKKPKEVFLFGCNTLASKDKDHRTQSQYTQVLIEHGMDATLAERVSETRYGSVGSTFEDQMSRAFINVPHIYGFHSTSPSGANIRGSISRYFDMIPNYANHLDKMSDASIHNDELDRAMVDSPMAQQSGAATVASKAEGLPFRNQICKTYDDKLSIVDRTKVVTNMLRSKDRMIYLDAVVRFLSQNIMMIRQNTWANEDLLSIHKNQDVMTDLDTKKKSSESSINLKLDLYDLDVTLGRIQQSEFNQVALGLLKPELKNLTSTKADLVCSQLARRGLRMKVNADDFNPAKISSVPMLFALQCLETEDPRLTTAVVKMIDSPSVMRDGNNLRAYLLALTRLPGAEAEKLAIARRIAALPNYGAFKPYTTGLIAAYGTGDEQLKAAGDLTKFDIHETTYVYTMFSRRPKSEALASALISNFTNTRGRESAMTQLSSIVSLLPESSDKWSQVGSFIAQLNAREQTAVFAKIIKSGFSPNALADVLISTLTRGDSNYLAYQGYLLSKMSLNAQQTQNLLSYQQSQPMLSGFRALASWILVTQPKNMLTKKERSSLRGNGQKATCELDHEYPRCGFEAVRL